MFILYYLLILAKNYSFVQKATLFYEFLRVSLGFPTIFIRREKSNPYKGVMTMSRYEKVFQRQKEFFKTGQTKSYKFRKRSLEKLREIIIANEHNIMNALRKDLNKSAFEAYSTEIGVVLNEIRFVMKHLRKWMKPKRVKTPITHFGSSSYIYPEPYGVSLIISPWNFPFQLTISPLVGAIAAGNCVIIKPSEFTSYTSKLMAKIIKENFGSEYVTVIEGGVKTNQALLKKPFDHIFFTGSPHVGKIIMKEASKHLTPITLELGGKSPCIVHEDSNISIAAKRIAWGKFLNAGQTCIAPDYLYVHKNIKDKFLPVLREKIYELYGNSILLNEDYSNIINEKHFERLKKLLKKGTIYFGGEMDENRLKIEPTIITDVSWDDPVMKEEIFGPILPILPYKNINEVYEGIENNPKPLALYVFTESEEIAQEFLERISFGGGCINDTVYHFANPHLPFGGVGTSGIGAYHGKESFKAFTHYKGVLKQTTSFDIPFRYPNIKNGVEKIKLFFK